MDKLCYMTDEQLVEMYGDGCNEAFDALLFRHKDALYNYISFHSDNVQDTADDIFQETFVKVIVSLREGRYTDKGHFQAWLQRIAYNVIMDRHRQSAQMPVVSAELSENFLTASTSPTEMCHETHLVNEQTLLDVKRLMNHLPAEQLKVVYLRFFEERSFKEISAVTGANVSTCLARMRYALINMRRMASEHGMMLSLI